MAGSAWTLFCRHILVTPPKYQAFRTPFCPPASSTGLAQAVALQTPSSYRGKEREQVGFGPEKPPTWVSRFCTDRPRRSTFWLMKVTMAYPGESKDPARAQGATLPSGGHRAPLGPRAPGAQQVWTRAPFLPVVPQAWPRRAGAGWGQNCGDSGLSPPSRRPPSPEPD